MVPGAFSFDEFHRLEALHALGLLDTPPEAEFDTLASLAAQLLDCPTAYVSLVDRDRQWMKARINCPLTQTVRAGSFCDHTIRGNAPLVIEDATVDPRFAASPLVTVPDGVRFYAGAPIHAPDARGMPQPIGALCVIDAVPRSIGASERQGLADLAALADALIARRHAASRATEIARLADRQATELERKDSIFGQAERMAMIGSWRMALGDEAIEWSDNVYRIHGLPVGEKPALGTALDFYPPAARAEVTRALAATIESGEPFDVETDFVAADGQRRRVRSMGEVERRDGAIVALVGVFQDITERHALESQLRRSADTDALTGIANRAAFDRALGIAMASARSEHTPLLLVLIDLDGFKAINDTLGHAAGDDVLCLTGRALSQPWLRDCLAARIGGDEFALIVDDPRLAHDLTGLQTRLADALRIPVEASGVTMTSAGSIGIAAWDESCRSVRDFARKADKVLYAAKRARVGAGRRAA